MRGITNLVIGKPVYMHFWVNMAISLRLHNDYPIQLITQKSLIEHIPPKCHLYDHLTFIEDRDIYTDKVLAAGKAKVNLYKYFMFDETVYLDVDGLCIKELTPLFENERDYVLQHDKLHWADDGEIRKHFKLQDEELHGSNSSYQFIRKGELAEKVYNEASKAMENPLPLSKQSNNWFGMQPDELYYAIGMAKAGIVERPYREQAYPIYFKPRTDYQNLIPLHEIIDKHFILGCYGSDRYNHKSIAKLYDKLNQNNWYKLLGENAIYKYHHLMKAKHKGR